jgi:acetoin utilization deacetylase AcuC-like enzyme
MRLPTGLLCDPAYRLHDTGAFHPEKPARMDAVLQGLHLAGLLPFCRLIPPRPATDEELLRVHSPAYLAQVQADVESGRYELSTGDTAIGPESERIARLAAGGVLAAVEAVLAGQVANAFAVVRPPGHHASAERGMGFCIYNNIAVAARHLQAVHGLVRVLILDWDVHHGNGTQDIFAADPSVLFCSSHQAPFYPGTGDAADRGIGAGEGFTVNIPLPAGTTGPELLAAWHAQILPAADAFAPQFVLISAGFDSRREDPLGGFQLLDADFATLTRLAMDLAQRHAGGRLVSALEGGYDLPGLAAASAAHMGALTDAHQRSTTSGDPYQRGPKAPPWATPSSTTASEPSSSAERTGTRPSP